VFGKKAGLVINLKSVLCLYNLGLTERFGTFYPLLRQAPIRYIPASSNFMAKATLAALTVFHNHP